MIFIFMRERTFSKKGNVTSFVGQTNKESVTSFVGRREYYLILVLVILFYQYSFFLFPFLLLLLFVRFNLCVIHWASSWW